MGSSICVTVFASKLAIKVERHWSFQKRGNMFFVQKFRLLSLISWINMGLTFSWPFLMESLFIILRVRERRIDARRLTLTQPMLCDAWRQRFSRVSCEALENRLCGWRRGWSWRSKICSSLDIGERDRFCLPKWEADSSPNPESTGLPPGRQLAHQFPNFEPNKIDCMRIMIQSQLVSFQNYECSAMI